MECGRRLRPLLWPARCRPVLRRQACRRRLSTAGPTATSVPLRAAISLSGIQELVQPIGVRVRVVRKQYHFRPSPKGLHAWDVDRLIALAHDLPVQMVPLDQVVELETNYWFDHGYDPTVRAMVDHMRLVAEADLSYAIILDPDGRVMDGMHRLAKALLLGHATITAKRLWALPKPDYTDVRPDELPYDV